MAETIDIRRAADRDTTRISWLDSKHSFSFSHHYDPANTHHGMLLVGLPYSEPALSATQTGGTPYGVSHVAGPNNDRPISDDERKLAIAQGKRLAEVALKLRG